MAKAADRAHDLRRRPRGANGRGKEYVCERDLENMEVTLTGGENGGCVALQ